MTVLKDLFLLYSIEAVGWTPPILIFLTSAASPLYYDDDFFSIQNTGPLDLSRSSGTHSPVQFQDSLVCSDPLIHSAGMLGLNTHNLKVYLTLKKEKSQNAGYSFVLVFLAKWETAVGVFVEITRLRHSLTLYISKDFAPKKSFQYGVTHAFSGLLPQETFPLCNSLKDHIQCSCDPICQFFTIIISTGPTSFSSQSIVLHEVHIVRRDPGNSNSLARRPGHNKVSLNFPIISYHWCIITIGA